MKKLIALFTFLPLLTVPANDLLADGADVVCLRQPIKAEDGRGGDPEVRRLNKGLGLQSAVGSGLARIPTEIRLLAEGNFHGLAGESRVRGCRSHVAQRRRGVVVDRLAMVHRRAFSPDRQDECRQHQGREYETYPILHYYPQFVPKSGSDEPASIGRHCWKMKNCETRISKIRVAFFKKLDAESSASF